MDLASCSQAARKLASATWYSLISVVFSMPPADPSSSARARIPAEILARGLSCVAQMAGLAAISCRSRRSRSSANARTEPGSSPPAPATQSGLRRSIAPSQHAAKTGNLQERGGLGSSLWVGGKHEVVHRRDRPFLHETNKKRLVLLGELEACATDSAPPRRRSQWKRSQHRFATDLRTEGAIACAGAIPCGLPPSSGSFLA
jgi:hypothetical protein